MVRAQETTKVRVGYQVGNLGQVQFKKRMCRFTNTAKC